MIAFSHLDIVHEGKILVAYLNRPKKANALNRELWFEIEKLAHWVDESPDIRVLILAGHGNHFTSGIDFSLIQDMSAQFQQKLEGGYCSLSSCSFFIFHSTRSQCNFLGNT